MERFFPLFLLKMENGMEWNGMEWNGNGTRFADLCWSTAKLKFCKQMFRKEEFFDSAYKIRHFHNANQKIKKIV